MLYIPVDDEADLINFEPQNVKVDVNLMKQQTLNYKFDKEGNIDQYDKKEEYKVTVTNRRPIPVTVQVYRHFDDDDWSITNKGNYGKYEKIDKDSICYTIKLKQNSKAEFSYTKNTTVDIDYYDEDDIDGLIDF